MRKSDMSRRLAVLESEATMNGPRLADDDPRVVAYQARAHQQLAELVEETTTGIKTHERLSPAKQILYWQGKVAEAEALIASNGVADDDDISALLMSGTTLEILRELRLEVATENIDEYREMLLAAELRKDRPKRGVVRRGGCFGQTPKTALKNQLNSDCLTASNL